MVVRAGLLAFSLVLFGGALPGAAQPSLVKDVDPGTFDPQRPGSSPSSFVSVGRRVVFLVGRSGGTRSLSDVAPGPLSSSPRELTAIGDRLFFSADDQTIGREPWVLQLGIDFSGKGKP